MDTRSDCITDFTSGALIIMSTAELESFHNHILMDARKCFGFSPQGHRAWTLLAGLDYTHRAPTDPQRENKMAQSTRPSIRGNKKTWLLCTVSEQGLQLLPDLQRTILRRRLTASGGLAQTRRYMQAGSPIWSPAPSGVELLQKQGMALKQSPCLIGILQFFVQHEN